MKLRKSLAFGLLFVIFVTTIAPPARANEANATSASVTTTAVLIENIRLQLITLIKQYIVELQRQLAFHQLLPADHHDATVVRHRGVLPSSSLVTVATVMPQITTVIVTPEHDTVSINGTLQLTAVVNDQNGNAMSDEAENVIWSSSDDTIVAVNSSGLVTAVAVGTATITATDGSTSGTATITVTAPVTTYVSTDFENNSVAPFGGGASITSAFAQSGTKSAIMTLTATDSAGPRLEYDFTSNPNPTLDPNGYYQRWYVMMPQSTIDSVLGGQVKLLLNRYNVEVSGDGSGAWLMLGVGNDFLGTNELAVWKDSDTSRLECNNGRELGSTGVLLQGGRWYEIETYYKRDTAAHTGQAKLWVDGTLVCNSNNDAGLGRDSATDVMSSWVGGVYTQNATTYPISVYVDDVVFANGYIQ